VIQANFACICSKPRREKAFGTTGGAFSFHFEVWNLRLGRSSVNARRAVLQTSHTTLVASLSKVQRLQAQGVAISSPLLPQPPPPETKPFVLLETADALFIFLLDTFGLLSVPVGSAATLLGATEAASFLLRFDVLDGSFISTPDTLGGSFDNNGGGVSDNEVGEDDV